MNNSIDFSKIKAFFFDLDGTIVDNNNLHAKAYLEVLMNENIAVASRFDYELIKGKKTKESFLHLGFSNEDAFRLTSLKQQTYRNYVHNKEISCLPYIHDILKLLSKSKEIYVVTGSSRETVILTLKSLEIDGFVKDLICAEDVKKGKPHPEPYLTALEKFNFTADEVIVIEDSLTGIYSAIDAGILTISLDVNYNHRLVRHMSSKQLFELIENSDEFANKHN